MALDKAYVDDLCAAFRQYNNEGTMRGSVIGGPPPPSIGESATLVKDLLALASCIQTRLAKNLDETSGNIDRLSGQCAEVSRPTRPTPVGSPAPAGELGSLRVALEAIEKLADRIADESTRLGRI